MRGGSLGKTGQAVDGFWGWIEKRPMSAPRCKRKRNSANFKISGVLSRAKQEKVMERLQHKEQAGAAAFQMLALVVGASIGFLGRCEVTKLSVRLRCPGVPCRV